MRTLYLLILTILPGIHLNAQVTITLRDSLNDYVEPYDYDTLLKGGYTIYFKVDDELEYIYLKKGNKIITELSSCSRGLPYKNLGYVVSDFRDHFVLAYSFGSGNAHHFELIRKSTGKNIIEVGAAWIDAVNDKQMLLYCINDVPSSKDKMVLYNICTGHREFFRFPGDIFNEPEVLNRIKIVRLSGKQLIIKYDTEKGTRKKIYNR